MRELPSPQTQTAMAPDCAVVGGVFLPSAQRFLLVGAYREVQPNPNIKFRQRQEDRNPFTSYIHYAYANMNSLVILSEFNVS